MMSEGPIRLAVPVTDEDHVRGPADAPITLVEYGDFECPFCGMAYLVVNAIERKYRAQLRLAFRHFPLPQHPHALAVDETSEFAADYGRFWEMHDMLFEHQRALAMPLHLAYRRGTINDIKREESSRLAQPFLMIGRKHFFIVETKRPQDMLDRAVLLQAVLYATHPEVQARYGCLCNSKRLEVFRVGSEPYDQIVLEIEQSSVTG